MKALSTFALAVGMLAACGAEREPTAADIVNSLERTERSYLGLERLEFAAAVERRLDEIHRLRLKLSEDGRIDEETVQALQDRHTTIADGLVELRLHEGPDWEPRRNELASLLRELEDHVVSYLRIDE